jgi:hypothetical protein
MDRIPASAKEMSRCAASMEEALSAYHDATGRLIDALSRMDADGACAAMETRERCVAAYRGAMDRWREGPKDERTAAAEERLRWHHVRIKNADADAVRYIRSLQDEVRVQLVRVGLAKKIERLYSQPAPETIRIVSGQG